MKRHSHPGQSCARGITMRLETVVALRLFLRELLLDRTQRDELEFAALPLRTDITLSSSVSGLTITPTQAKSISFQLWSPHFTVALGSGLDGLLGELSQWASSPMRLPL